MKTISIDDLSARREELLSQLAHGETFAVVDHGREVATLLPRHLSDAAASPLPDDTFYRLRELAAKSTDDGVPLSNAEIDRLIYAG